MTTKLALGILIAMAAVGCGTQPTSIYTGTNVEPPAAQTAPSRAP